jgi:hypothetical protein
MNKLAAGGCSQSHASLDGRLASYLGAAGALSAITAAESQAVVIGNNTIQPFGINGAVNIDFNNDGQTDFQIDHDRVPISGSTLDYLQIDKNDVNGELNPLVFDPGPDLLFQATPFLDGATPRNDANESAYVINPYLQGSYPAALKLGTSIGPQSTFDFQETGNFQTTGKDIRANRLIDEDATQIDRVLGGQAASGVQVPFNGPNFRGLDGATRYLGLKMDLNNAGVTNYGWVGIQIDNEADATGAVVGYGYETLANTPIPAGAVPEPGTLGLSVLGGVALLGSAARRRLRGKKTGSHSAVERG